MQQAGNVLFNGQMQQSGNSPANGQMQGMAQAGGQDSTQWTGQTGQANQGTMSTTQWAGQAGQANQGTMSNQGQANSGQNFGQSIPANATQAQQGQFGQQNNSGQTNITGQMPQSGNAPVNGQMQQAGNVLFNGQMQQSGNSPANGQMQGMAQTGGQDSTQWAGQTGQANQGTMSNQGQTNSGQNFGQPIPANATQAQQEQLVGGQQNNFRQGNVNGQMQQPENLFINNQPHWSGDSRMSPIEQLQRPQQAAMQQAKNQLLNQVMENTPQTMNVLRDLAQLLLDDGNVNQKDALLLKSFVNGKEALLNAKEAQQLQQLIRLCQANVPATIQQAALQQNIPDLPRLWAFMQLCDIIYTRNMTARQLKKAGKDVAAFVLSMRNSMEGDNRAVPGQRSLNFMMPMYMGEESTYPSYIHVYDEKQPDPETGELKKETWLRLCVLTDNIGAVEITCRVYQENQLDMRLFFSSTEIANEFRAEMNTLRNSLRDSKLRLKEIKVGAAGERRFM